MFSLYFDNTLQKYKKFSYKVRGVIFFRKKQMMRTAKIKTIALISKALGEELVSVTQVAR